MPEPLVSVVTPSYNQARFLKQTLETVMQQDYRSLEYIVMDGGSTDGSVELIREYGDRLAYWVSEPDKGQADAISRGWQCAHGEILAWLNSDDTYTAGAISAVVQAFQHHPQVNVVTADCHVIDENGAFVRLLPSGLDFQALLSGNPFPQPGVFCRRSALEQAGGLRTDLHYVFDWALWLRLWLNGATFYHLPQVVANFRIWGHSKTGSGAVSHSLSGGTKFACERFNVLTEWSTSSAQTRDDHTRALIETARSACALELALLYDLAGESETAQIWVNEFVKTERSPGVDLLHPQALATHLAYAGDKANDCIQQFVARLTSALGLSKAQAATWQSVLRAETYLVQAWHARYRLNYKLATLRFLRAIANRPALALRRRVLSPTVKSLVQTLLHPRDGEQDAR